MQWRYVHREDTLKGLPDGTEVLVLFGDGHGDFDLNDDRMRVRHWMFVLEKEGRIKTTYRYMNEPPDLFPKTSDHADETQARPE